MMTMMAGADSFISDSVPLADRLAVSRGRQAYVRTCVRRCGRRDVRAQVRAYVRTFPG